MATERLILEVRTVGTRQVNRDLKNMRKEARSANKTLALLRSTLVVVAGARVIGQFLELADSLTNIRNRLRLVTTSTAQLNAVQARLFSLSQETRSSFEANAILFNRLARSTDGLGLSFNELLDVTTGITQALAISGATSQEARNALIQFSQGLAAGAVRGDELRSVVEQLPRLADAIAKEFSISADSTARSLGVTEEALRSVQQETGNLAGGALIAFAKANEGALTTARVIKALQNDLSLLDAEFAKIDITVGQAFTKFQNELTLFIGGLSNSIKLGERLDIVLTVIARNLDVIALSLAALITIGAFNLLTSQALRFGVALRGIAVFLTTGLVSGFKALLLVLKPVVILFRTLAVLSTLSFLPLIGIVLAVVVGLVALRVAIDKAGDRFSFLTKAFKTAVGAIFGLLDGLVEAFTMLPAALADLGVQAANAFISGFESLTDGVIKLLNAIPGVEIKTSDLKRIENDFAGSAARVKEILTRNISEGIQEGAKSTDTFKGIASAVEGIKKLLAGGLLPDDFNEARFKALRDEISGTRDSLSSFDTAATKAAVSIRNIRASVDPAESAFKKLNDALEAFSKISKKSAEFTAFARETLVLLAQDLVNVQDAEFAYGRQLELVNKLVKENLLTTEQASLARKQFAVQAQQDFANTLGAVFPLIAAEQDLAEVEVFLLKNKNLLAKANITADEAQKRLTRSTLGFGPTAMQAADQVKVLQKAYADAAISADELASGTRKAMIAQLEQQRSVGAGAERFFLKMTEDATDSAAQIESVLSTAFKGAEDALVEFINTGKLNFQDLAKTIQEELLRGAIKALLAQLASAAAGQQGAAGGGEQGAIGSIFGAIGQAFASGQNGLDFTVGSGTSAANVGGRDNRLVAFRAHDGEEVSVTPKREVEAGGGNQRPISVTINVTPASDGSEATGQAVGQAVAGAAEAIRRFDQRNN